MRNLDYHEYKICQAFARLFEVSTKKANFSSPMFIRRLMTSNLVSMYENKSYLFLTLNEDDVIDEMNCIYKASNKAPTYSNEEMYWIGYIYASIAFLYDKSFKSIYKLISPKEIVKYYNIYHTFSVETAAEKIMENINYSNLDINQKGVILMKKLMSNK